MDVRGVSYMIDEVPSEVACADLCVVRDQLCCTAVILIGTDLERMVAAAGFALEIGLDVWIEPHPVDVPRRRMLADLTAMAAAAEALRRRFPGRVTLIVGCEFSVHLAGMLPGRPEVVRLLMTMRWRHVYRRRITRIVNDLLGAALAAARPVFGGPITYASASWEDVDWSGFDYAGVNLYRSASNSARFEDLLVERMRLSGKPLVITEFGCGAHDGGAQRGPGSFKIVEWLHTPPRIRAGTVRNERVQSAYLGDLIEIYDRHRVLACFVYTFALREYPHHADPGHDLDMAGFGLVKVDPDDRDEWAPKLAFHEVARRYGELAERPPAAPRPRPPRRARADPARSPRAVASADGCGPLRKHRRFHLDVELDLRVNRYRVFADDGRGNAGPLLAIAEQERGPLRQELTFHADATGDHPLFRMQPCRSLPHFGPMEVSAADGAVIGRTIASREPLGERWLLEQDQPRAMVEIGEPAASAAGRRLWNVVPRLGDLPFPWRYRFDFVRDGVRLATVARTTRLQPRYVVTVADDHLDRRLVLAQAVALEAAHHR